MTEITIDVVLITDPYRYKEFKVETNNKNYLLHKRKLEMERGKIVKFLERFKEEGIIKSVWIPKNKRIQKELNQLVKLKRTIDKSLQKIKDFFR